MNISDNAGLPVPQSDRLAKHFEDEEAGTAKFLVVSMERTLIASDLEHEMVIALVMRSPWLLLLLPIWMIGGKGYFKRKILRRMAAVDPAGLPYNESVLETARRHKARGGFNILVAALDKTIATKVAEHLRLFDEVIAGDSQTSKRGEELLRAVHSRIGRQSFCHVGSDQHDLPLWRSSATALVTNASPHLVRKLRRIHKDVVVLDSPEARFADHFRALRPHQWAKNLLVFVPLITSHRIAERETAFYSGLAFLAFCFTASTIYLLNDFADLEADRSHSSKRNRPIASGRVRASHAIGLGIFCTLTALACSLALPPQFGVCLAGYALLAGAYTMYLKQKLILDAICLSALYAGRIVGGSAAVGVFTSTWLLTFAMMMFFSLALAKRYAELDAARKRGAGDEAIKGRCYRVADMQQLANLGTSSGLVSVLVIALYVNSPAVILLYATPGLLLLVCPLVFYWIARVWMLVIRGQMHEDPIVFALHDRTSWLVLLCVLLLVYLATVFSFTGKVTL